MGITIDNCPIKQVCGSCVKGQLSRRPFSKKSKTSSKRPLEIIHTNLCGPMSTTTPGGRKYVILIDDFSKYTHSYLLTHKSEVELILKQFVKYCKTQFAKRLEIFRLNRGGEYIGHTLKDYLRDKGIVFQHTMPYTPGQNSLPKGKTDI